MWKNYRKTVAQTMRPYIVGEDMSKISISPEDKLEVGGMVARNSANHNDQWYIGRMFFKENYKEV